MGTLHSRLLPGALIIAADDYSSLWNVLPQTQVRMWVTGILTSIMCWDHEINTHQKSMQCPEIHAICPLSPAGRPGPVQSVPGPHDFRHGLGPNSTEDEASGELTPDTHVEAMSVFLAVTIFYVLSRCRRVGWRPCHPFSVFFTSRRTIVKPWTCHLTSRLLLRTRFPSVQLSPSVWWKFLVED